MKARKMVAAAAVAGCAVVGSTGAAGALTAPQASVPSNDTVNGITVKVGGLVGGLLSSVAVPQAPAVAVPSGLPQGIPAPDVKWSTSAISVTVGSTHASTGLPAVQAPAVTMPQVPQVPQVPSMSALSTDVPDPTGHVALLKLYILQGMETAKAMSESFTADGTKTFEAYSAETTRAIALGLELAGLGPIQVTLAQKATEAWSTFEANREFVTRTLSITI